MILNVLPWKRTMIIGSFFRLHSSTAFQTLVDYEGYSISSKGFLESSELNSSIQVHFILLIPKMSILQSCHLLFNHFQFTLIHGSNISGSYAILFFTASDFTFTTRHIHS